MKNKTLKFFDKIVMALLGLFPFLSACDGPIDNPVMMYGTPTADYLIKGVVTDATTNAPIQDIQVVLQGNEQGVYPDTVKTDSEGKYSLSFQSFPYTTTSFGLKVEDVDGTANGGLYTTKETSAEVVASSWDKTKADGWYSGKATVVKDIKLSK